VYSRLVPGDMELGSHWCLRCMCGNHPTSNLREGELAIKLVAARPTCPNLAEPTQRNLLYYKHAILVNSFNWSSKSSLKDVLLMLIVHTCAPPPPSRP